MFAPSVLVRLRGHKTLYCSDSGHKSGTAFFLHEFFISQKYFDGVKTSRTTKHISQTQIVLKVPIFP